MAEGNLKAGERALSQAAEKVATCKQDIDTLTKQLSGQIESMQARWGGQGAMAFGKLHVAWQEKQQKITSALNDFERSLIDTEKDNVATDESSMEASNRLMGRLGG